MKTFLFTTMCLFSLTACEHNDLNVEEDFSENFLSVEAEISESAVVSRTTTDSAGKVTFANGDKIGFYTPTSRESGLWTLTDNSWTSEKAYVWPKKNVSYNFCAYYPFIAAETRDAITMPDLSAQDGTIDNIGKYDFLVARCTASYATHNGTVSFTGEEAFKHTNAMLAITLKTNADTDGSSLTGLTLSATDLVSTSTYHFGESQEADGTTVNVGGQNELKLSGLSDSIQEGVKKVFIVNPLESEGNLTISVDYTRENETYKASAEISAATIQAGKLNNLTLLIKKSGLVVAGNTVTDWVVNDLGDVSVEENPAQ